MSSETDYCIGLDVGSTTVKGIILDNEGTLVFSKYVRHYSEVRPCLAKLLQEILSVTHDRAVCLSITGSGAISFSRALEVPFIQEVLASSTAIRKYIPDADVVIELGGEDAKLTFLTGGVDQRMNETCAGGTGAFIDQMASFLRMDVAELDRLAGRHTTIYPIASRCGVFAKTDILPLLNQGCAREDIAASIMQAVVNQTLSGLARGRTIKGKVVFLGGPLFFLESLRERFKVTLKEMTEAVFPENGHFFVALGAGLVCKATVSNISLKKAISILDRPSPPETAGRLPPLFASRAEQDAFALRHSKSLVTRRELETAAGDAWIGFDCGSTTMKAALINDAGELLYSFYDANKGDPLAVALAVLKDIYARKPPGLAIRAAAATGYGSAMLKKALQLDVDEVETVAHFTASRFFEPKVSFILDIGGQDIKCMRIREGTINRIHLNEACSAGCGSFIENFSASLNLPLENFVKEALAAAAPVDLGTRCTVFMNSKVRQAQKEGAAIGDIAAGLSYAVVRNACFKVMKISSVAELGDYVVAQGGAFVNDALLRALELELRHPVLRPGISGLMGAFGAALIARKQGPSGQTTSLPGPEAVDSFSSKTGTIRCKGCGNRCLLTITTFADKRRFISGNRCERGAQMEPRKCINLYAYKYKRLFDAYTAMAAHEAKRGSIGIPRALNIFENYPLWFTLFTKLGFQVILSSPSSKELFYKGYETIPSQTVCYPAKLSHGHVLDLVEKGVRAIFFPCLPHEQKDFTSRAGTFNCPVVIGYPELLARNISRLEECGIPLIHQFLPLDRMFLAKRMRDIPFFADIPLCELEEAVCEGFKEMDRFHNDIRHTGEAALAELSASGRMGIVLAGHPYHIDPEVHHGVAELVTSCGLAVLTEDSVAHLMPDPGPLRVVDQWSYHSRLYRAGAYAATMDNLAVLQLVSFGCGLDAITSDQLEEIVTLRGRLYAQIKIDEGANLGPARIRIRSLLAAMRERLPRGTGLPTLDLKIPPAFTREMRRTHTLLIPQMSPVHFQFMEAVFSPEGFNSVQLPKVDREAIELGLRHVNNDACFPAIVVVGQLLQAVRSGTYDLEKIALVISQTGGGCRATNYIGLLRKALVDAGLERIPIVSFSTNIQPGSPGFRLTGKMLRRAIMAGHYGDALMRMVHRVRPYEMESGATDALAAHWGEIAKKNIVSGNIPRFEFNMLSMIREFDQLPLLTEERKPRVGMVGEILLKYHPDANNKAAQIVEQEGGEAVITDIMDFVLYGFYDHIFNYKHLSGPQKAYRASLAGIAFLEFTRLSMRIGFGCSKRFSPPIRFYKLRKKTKNLISLGHQSGEGWLLAAEMVEMLESGVNNILCMQPFGCLPNHITGKGLLKALKRRYPSANIITLDYDAGASEVNQINRIKLMMSVAKHKP